MLTLHVPPWRFRQRVKLNDGADRVAHFAPAPIHLTGTVFRGEQGARASIDFNVNLRPDQGQVQVETDEKGRYEADLFRPGTYVVEISGEETAGQPMREILELPDRRYVERDFHLHHGWLTVEVLEQQTHRPIKGASVFFLNEAADGQKSGASAETGGDGIAISGALRPGNVSLSVAAEGYREHRTRPLPLTGGEAEPVVVELQPLGKRATVVVMLGDGRPASGADLLVLESIESGVPLWSGASDAAGRSAVPWEFSRRGLLVRHQDGAGAVQRLPPPEEMAPACGAVPAWCGRRSEHWPSRRARLRQCSAVSGTRQPRRSASHGEKESPFDRSRNERLETFTRGHPPSPHGQRANVRKERKCTEKQQSFRLSSLRW